MITSPQITNIEIFEFIAVPVFKLFSRSFVYKQQRNRNC